MPQKQPEAVMNDMYVTRKEYQDLFDKYNEILDKINSFPASGGSTAKPESRRAKGGAAADE